MTKTYEFDINNVKEKYEINKVAKQANGSVLLSSGKSVLLATIVIDENQISDGDFLPLTVQYVEKTYAFNKIPGGFFKREAKPSEFETLTSRIIDRSLRPLFDKGFRYNTVVNVIVLSADENSDLQTLALKAANMAVYTSNIPVNQNVYPVRIGKIDNEVIINPTATQLKQSSLDLFVTGMDDELLMIEMMSKSSNIDDNFSSNEIKEEELIDILQIAKEAIKSATTIYKNEVQLHPNMLCLTYIKDEISENIIDIVENKYTTQIKNAIEHMAVSERSSKLQEIAQEIIKNDNVEEELQPQVIQAIQKRKKQLVRQNIIENGQRADKRGLKEIRNITVATNILPNAHSSCLFTRGQTQALAVLTIGSSKDSQMFETLTSKEPQFDNFMLHYNFPAFSVGEASPMGHAGRREIGHGNLAKRALSSSIVDISDKSVRIVSEILESNGSSSMATVCGSSIALKAANIQTNELIAGIAMGLVRENGKFAILSDITGLEDHDGDMDFKIAGNKNGVTALQMDLKIDGLDLSVLKDAFMQAKEGREHILNIMQKACESIVYTNVLPLDEFLDIKQNQIGTLIGQGGKTIKQITSDYNVNIDINKETNKVKISSQNREDLDNAKEFIKNLLAKSDEPKIQYKEQDVLMGTVTTITTFGAFVKLPSGDDGLLHISKISKDRVENVHDVLKENQEIEVVVLKNEDGKISLASSNI